MSDLVGNPEDRFSHDEAHMVLFLVATKIDHQDQTVSCMMTAMALITGPVKYPLSKTLFCWGNLS